MMASRIPIQCLRREYQANRERFLAVFDKVCARAAYCDGAFVHGFEKDFAAFLGAKSCSGVNSGTSALLLAMKALGVQGGDQVIVPSATFFSTASAVVMAGAEPVFADCDCETWQISVESAAKLINKKTKLIVGVHLYGGAFDVHGISDLASQAGIPFLEDACQAAGTLIGDRYAGTFGAAGCFSFYPTKNLGAFGDAGAVVTDDAELAKTLRMLRNYGSEKKYHNKILGVNSRLDELQAALLRTKLGHLAELITERERIAAAYLDGIQNPAIRLPKLRKNTNHVWHQFVIQTEDRDGFQTYLADHGIQTVIHYPIPPHLSECYQYLGHKAGDYPVAEHMAKTVLSLPMFNGMREDEVQYFVETVNAYGRDV